MFKMKVLGNLIRYLLCMSHWHLTLHIQHFTHTSLSLSHTLQFPILSPPTCQYITPCIVKHPTLTAKYPREYIIHLLITICSLTHAAPINCSLAAIRHISHSKHSLRVIKLSFADTTASDTRVSSIKSSTRMFFYYPKCHLLVLH